MPRNPTIEVTFSRVDRSGEYSGFSLHTATVQDMANESLELIAWNTAVGTVCDGEAVKRSAISTKKLSNAKYAAAGNREEKWLLFYSDNVTLAIYQTELPMRKSTVLPPINTDMVDLTAVPWVAFKSAFEAFAKSPEGNAVTLVGVQLMGKNT